MSISSIQAGPGFGSKSYYVSSLINFVATQVGEGPPGTLDYQHLH